LGLFVEIALSPIAHTDYGANLFIHPGNVRHDEFFQNGNINNRWGGGSISPTSVCLRLADGFPLGLDPGDENLVG